MHHQSLLEGVRLRDLAGSFADLAIALRGNTTPSSIDGAEAELAVMSREPMQAVEAAMARARGADRAGDRSACEQALADAQCVLGQQ